LQASLPRRRIDVTQREFCATFGKGFSQNAAETLSGPGNQYDFILEIEHFVWPPLRLASYAQPAILYLNTKNGNRPSFANAV
jgi:hypothetical protein